MAKQCAEQPFFLHWNGRAFLSVTCCVPRSWITRLKSSLSQSLKLCASHSSEVISCDPVTFPYLFVSLITYQVFPPFVHHNLSIDMHRNVLVVNITDFVYTLRCWFLTVDIDTHTVCLVYRKNILVGCSAVISFLIPPSKKLASVLSMRNL